MLIKSMNFRWKYPKSCSPENHTPSVEKFFVNLPQGDVFQME